VPERSPPGGTSLRQPQQATQPGATLTSATGHAANASVSSISRSAALGLALGLALG